jgi:hypothetical protein
VPDRCRAGRETLSEEFLILPDKSLQLAFLRCDFVKGFDIKLAELFNI